MDSIPQLHKSIDRIDIDIKNNQRELDGLTADITDLYNVNDQTMQLIQKQSSLTKEIIDNQNKINSSQQKLIKLKAINDKIMQIADKQKKLVNEKTELLTKIDKLQEDYIRKSTVSFMTWNAGRIIKKAIKNIGELKNIEKYLNIKADFHCFQEMDPRLNYEACGQIGYVCFKVDYNFKNDVPVSSIVTLINADKYEIVNKFSESREEMIAEDTKIQTQKFTRFALVIAKCKTTNDYFNIVNVHLKGGPAGYGVKKQLFERLIKFVNANAKEGYVIMGGDFNINFDEQKRGDYGYQFLIDNGFKEDCKDSTLKRSTGKPAKMPTIPNIKYDYVFYKSTNKKPFDLVKCEVITPNKPKPENFDHYPKINTFEYEPIIVSEKDLLQKERKLVDADPEFNQLLADIEHVKEDHQYGGDYDKYKKYKRKYVNLKYNL
jgi:endonuclease/exonuclease/phosphatase family metal-dependent hydrolase